MRVVKDERGFEVLLAEAYIGEAEKRLIQESSAIGDYDDSMANPGSSFLWVGEHHHLNRDEVRELIRIMQGWLDNKRLDG